MAAREDGLTPLQRRFVNLYFGDGRCNATQTYLLLKPEITDRGLAGSCGGEILRNPAVQEVVKKRTAEIITPTELIQRQADLVRMSIAPAVEVLGPGQVRINYEKAEEAGLLAHAENVDYNARGQAVVRFPTQESKNKAAALLGKWLQMEQPKPAEALDVNLRFETIMFGAPEESEEAGDEK